MGISPPSWGGRQSRAHPQAVSVLGREPEGLRLAVTLDAGILTESVLNVSSSAQDFMEVTKE